MGPTLSGTEPEAAGLICASNQVGPPVVCVQAGSIRYRAEGTSNNPLGCPHESEVAMGRFYFHLQAGDQIFKSAF
jgi:hypothetical protein